MTNYVQLKRAITSLLLLSLLAGCSVWNSWFGREEVNLGEYVTLEAENMGEEQSVRWVFTQLPDSSKLLGFLPADTLSKVTFKPDVEGDYEVVMTITNGDDVEETKFFYAAVAPEDSNLVNAEVPEFLSESVQDEDTTVADTPQVNIYTDSGDQRNYLSKVVSPGQKKTKTAPKKSFTRQTTAGKPNRGALIPQADKTYTIQLSSWPSLDEAQVAASELLDAYGIDSYIQRAFFKDKDEVYYRLRVGNFKNHSEALAYAKEIQAMTNLPAWVDFVRQEM